MTNADRIRAMTDEELTKVILCPYDTAGEPMDIMPCIKENGTQELASPEFCNRCILEWLGREVKEHEMTEQEVIKYLETHGYIDDEVKDRCIPLLEKQIPKQPINEQGIPTWGYCPTCGDAVTKYGSPVGCKNCLQRIDWSKA